MANDFLCPYCKGKLNVLDHIVFSTKTHAGKVGLFFLSPKLGDYETITHPSFEISEGEQNEFYCPICHANLAALEFNENLIKVLMADENSVVYEILFSGVAGEKCTYKLNDKEMEAFGDNSHKYLDYLNDAPRY